MADELAKAGALADTSKLTKYKGRDVLRTRVAIRNAGDGLSQALRIDPEELEQGSTVYVVLECEVDDHIHKRIKDTDALELVQVLRAGDATLIESDVVTSAIREQADRIERAKEQAAGIQRLPGQNGETAEDDEAAVLTLQHQQGVHADGLRDGCPECEAEREAEESESGG